MLCFTVIHWRTNRCWYYIQVFTPQWVWTLDKVLQEASHSNWQHMLVLVQHFCSFNFSFILLSGVSYCTGRLFVLISVATFAGRIFLLDWQAAVLHCELHIQMGALGLFLCLPVCEKTLKKSLDLVIHPHTADFYASILLQAGGEIIF